MKNAQADTTDASNEDNGGEDDDDSSKDDEAMTLGYQVLLAWEHRKDKVEYDYAILCWPLSVLPDV